MEDLKSQYYCGLRLKERFVREKRLINITLSRTHEGNSDSKANSTEQSHSTGVLYA